MEVKVLVVIGIFVVMALYRGSTCDDHETHSFIVTEVCYNFLHLIVWLGCLLCFDIVSWASGGVSGLRKLTDEVIA